MIRKKLPKLKQSIVFMGEWGGQLLFPLDSRTHKNEPVKQILAKIRPLVDSMPSTDAFLWSWESGLPGIKEDAASDLSLVISSSQDYKHIFDNMQKLKKRIEKDGVFNHVRQDLQLNSPGYEVDLDFNVLANVGLDPRQVAKTIEVFFSGDRSLYFDKEGIPYTILIEGKGERPWDLNGLYLTNPMNRPISLGAVAHLKPVVGPEVLYHYNQMRAAVIDVELPKNMKLTQGMSHFLEKVNAELPKSYKKTWVGFAKSYEESRNVMVFLLLLALVFIFAILAVQFENFIDPVIILMTIPFAGFGALVFMIVFQSSFNIYTQIGLITLIGLISKHGILIVEFANQLSKQMSVKEAIIEAAALRLRPILMTTGAMLCGAAPLIFSTSAGYEAQRAIGLVLVGGLSIGTVFTLFLLPTMYCMIKRAS